MAVLLLACIIMNSAAPLEAQKDHAPIGDPDLLPPISARAEQVFLASWAQAKLPGPPLIESEAQLLAAGPFISPVLSGGLGNILLQLATIHTLAKQHSVLCITAWWDQSDAGLRQLYRPYQGRGDPAPGITLKHIFPGLHFVSYEPAYRGVTSSERCHCLRNSNLMIKFVLNERAFLL